MELNRLLGADLTIAHVQSVRPSLMPLLRWYERDGLLQIRPSLRMPQFASMPFEPNEETLWNNQLVNFQDCLYQFKERFASKGSRRNQSNRSHSARFIGFPDWDDLLVGNVGAAMPFADGLHQFAQRHPMAAAFVPKRFKGQIESLRTIAIFLMEISHPYKKSHISIPR